MVIGFAGAREGFPPAVINPVIETLVAAGSSIFVGCCVGVDETVVRAAVQNGAAANLVIFAAFGPDGRGAFSLTAKRTVFDAVSRGASVHWWSGGELDTPLRVRLARRTTAFISALAAERREGTRVGLASFFGAWPSRGTLLGARSALSAGVPLVCFFAPDVPPVGVAAALPGVTGWRPASSRGAFGAGFTPVRR